MSSYDKKPPKKQSTVSDIQVTVKTVSSTGCHMSFDEKSDLIGRQIPKGSVIQSDPSFQSVLP